MITSENKKAFDPTICFTFFGSWLRTIERLETKKDATSKAYRLFKAIAYYSMYDIVPDFSNNTALNAAWSLLEQEIDMSISKRQRGFAKDMLNEKYQSIIKAVAEHPNSSLREIAEITSTDKNMVSRVKKKYKEEIEKLVVDDVVIGNANALVYNTDSDIDNDYYIANDSMGQDGNGTAGQDFSYIPSDDDDLPF